MENSKICPNCGATNNVEIKFCTSCGVAFNQQNIPVNMVNNNFSPNMNNAVYNQSNDSSDGTIYGVLSLILYFAGSIIIFIISCLLPEGEIRNSFSSLSGMCPMAGIVTMIIGRVKYPNNKFLKVVMWIIISSIILSALAFILFIFWCYVTCSNMKGCS